MLPNHHGSYTGGSPYEECLPQEILQEEVPKFRENKQHTKLKKTALFAIFENNLILDIKQNNAFCLYSGQETWNNEMTNSHRTREEIPIFFNYFFNFQLGKWKKL